MKTRIDSIDTAKGLTLLFVIYLHISACYGGHPYPDSDFGIAISTFFMPVFFILSGLFFSAKNDFIPWLKKKTKRLLIPYCFFYILTFLVSFLVVRILGVETKNGFAWSNIFIVFRADVFSNSTIWFLLALFWSSLFLYLIVKFLHSKWSQLLIVVLLFCFGWTCNAFTINIPLYFDSAMSMLPFLYLGYLLKSIDFVKYIEGQGKILLVLGLLLMMINLFTAEGTSLVNNRIGDPAHYFFGALVGSFSIIFICAFLNKIPVATFIGRNSLTVLCIHGYILNFVTLILKKFQIDMIISSLIAFVLVTLSFYIIVPLCKRFIPWAIGEERNSDK